MAELFLKQGKQYSERGPGYEAKQYSEGRPSYPQELFDFIASKTPTHDLVWDAGTGTGQAAASLAKIYKNVVATDINKKQLEFAPKLPNVRYVYTPPKMSISEIEHNISLQSSVDLVISAQAMHWFDLPTFYQNVKWVLKKPNGVIAAWCYTSPEINPQVDSVHRRLYNVDARPYQEGQGKDLVDLKYETIDFPFEPVDGVDHTGPFNFKIEKLMDLDAYFTYLRSWSAYHTAKAKGIELLTDALVEDFKLAWIADGQSRKIVTFPVYLRIGRVELG